MRSTTRPAKTALRLALCAAGALLLWHGCGLHNNAQGAARFSEQWVGEGGNFLQSGYTPGKFESLHTGSQSWDQPIGLEGLSFAVTSGNVIFNALATDPLPGLLTSRIRAVDLKTGTQVWSYDKPDSWLSGAADDRVYGVKESKLFCLDARSGKELWSTPKVSGNARVLESGILVHAIGSLTYCDRKTGTVVWQKNLPPGFDDEPVVADKSKAYTVGIGENDKRVVVAHDLKNGRVEWTCVAGTAQVHVFHCEDGQVYACEGEYLKRLDGKTGKVLASAKGHVRRPEPFVADRPRGLGGTFECHLASRMTAFTNEAIYCANGRLLFEFNKKDLTTRGIAVLPEAAIAQPVLTDDVIIVGGTTKTTVLRRSDLTPVQTIDVGGQPILVGATLLCALLGDDNLSKVHAFSVEPGALPAAVRKTPTRTSWSPEKDPLSGTWNCMTGMPGSGSSAQGKVVGRQFDVGWTHENIDEIRVEDLGTALPPDPASLPLPRACPLAISDGVLVFIKMIGNVASDVTALDVEKGDILWRLKIPGLAPGNGLFANSGCTRLLANKGRVYVLANNEGEVSVSQGTKTSLLYIIDSASGRLISACQLAVQVEAGLWLDDGRIYAYDKTSIVELDSKEAEVVKQSEFKIKDCVGVMAVYSGVAFLLCSPAPDGVQHVVAWDMQMSKELWRCPVKGAVRPNPAMNGVALFSIDNLLILHTGSGAQGIDTKTGAERWSATIGNDAARVAPRASWIPYPVSKENVLCIDSKGRMLVARSKDGSANVELQSALQTLCKSMASEQVEQVFLLDDAVLLVWNSSSKLFDFSGQLIKTFEASGQVAAGCGAIWFMEQAHTSTKGLVPRRITRCTAK